MQGFGDYCSKMQVNDTLTLRDIRDNNDYTIAKLLDGKCWMTQNLRIVGVKVLTPNDSDLLNNFTLPQNDGSGNWSDAYWWDLHDYLHPKSQDNDAYYSWHTAIADSNNLALASEGGVAPQSICPKGWRLPNREDSTYIKNYYNYYNIQTLPVNFKNTGSYYGNNGDISSPSNNQYAYTAWWNSSWTKQNGSNNQIWDFPDTLYLRNNAINVGLNGGAGYGGLIRCISKN